MKKFLSSLIAVCLLSVGFVAASGQAPVSAAPSQCGPGYPPCPEPETDFPKGEIKDAKADIKDGKSTEVKMTFDAPGNLKPKGTVTLTITDENGNPAKDKDGNPVEALEFKVHKKRDGNGKVVRPVEWVTKVEIPALTVKDGVTYTFKFKFNPDDPRLEATTDKFNVTGG